MEMVTRTDRQNIPNFVGLSVQIIMRLFGIIVFLVHYNKTCWNNGDVSAIKVPLNDCSHRIIVFGTFARLTFVLFFSCVFFFIVFGHSRQSMHTASFFFGPIYWMLSTLINHTALIEWKWICFAHLLITNKRQNCFLLIFFDMRSTQLSNCLK